MSYHTSGSMSRSYGGGYGTIKISIEESDHLRSGTSESYITGVPPTAIEHLPADVYNINGEIVLVDSKSLINLFL